MAPAPRVLADEPQGARPTGFFYFQPSVRAFYEGNVSQVTVAMLITANFLCNVVEKEIDPQGVIMPGTWRKLEITFNVMFLIELIINMYARWLKRFWCDSWNIFDVLVVTVGCISFGVELVGPLKLLRCLRAFRVFRLFKRVKALNRIIVMIVSALPGVANAFLVIVIMVSIYSLVAVEFFSTFGVVMDTEYTGTTQLDHWDPTVSTVETAFSDQTVGYTNLGTGQPSNSYISNFTARTPTPHCAYHNAVGGIVPSITTRNLCHGVEYWGTFTRAWFTLFQLLTGESWAEAIARPVLFGWAEYGSASIYISAIFFISFVVINAFILFNVFVAVLLDKVIAPDEAEPDELVGASAHGATPGKININLGANFSPSRPLPAPGTPAAAPGSPSNSLHNMEPTAQVDMQVAKSTFNKFDTDGKGSIDVRELGAMLTFMKINVKGYESILDKFDANKSGTLEFDEFTNLLTQIRAMPPKTPTQMMMRLLETQQALMAGHRDLLLDSQLRASEVLEVKRALVEINEKLDLLPIIGSRPGVNGPARV